MICSEYNSLDDDGCPFHVHKTKKSSVSLDIVDSRLGASLD